ncbi:MAG: hypothetical protein ABSC71_03120, partial [Candidatus Acidiferrales bacterium]
MTQDENSDETVPEFRRCEISLRNWAFSTGFVERRHPSRQKRPPVAFTRPTKRSRWPHKNAFVPGATVSALPQLFTARLNACKRAEVEETGLFLHVFQIASFCPGVFFCARLASRVIDRTTNLPENLFESIATRNSRIESLLTRFQFRTHRRVTRPKQRWRPFFTQKGDSSESTAGIVVSFYPRRALRHACEGSKHGDGSYFGNCDR